MACGTPVAAARAGALPETCGEAARYADPRDARSVADAVEAALDDAADLVPQGIARAALFSWERTAREVDVLLHA
jgi:glycosyltransferase involved in cell wall biosynthesis